MPAPSDAKPLIMGTRSIIAWQANAKTQTRRLPSPRPDGESWRPWRYDKTPLWQWRYPRFGTHGQRLSADGFAPMRQPYVVGQLLWIREALVPNDNWIVVYQSDQIRVRFEGGVETMRWKWKRPKLPAIFMPRWACRHYGRVISTRPERLQEISVEDAVAEGTLVGGDYSTLIAWHHGASVDLYLEWWDSMHKKPGTRSEDNPVIWRYELEPADAS